MSNTMIAVLALYAVSTVSLLILAREYLRVEREVGRLKGANANWKKSYNALLAVDGRVALTNDELTKKLDQAHWRNTELMQQLERQDDEIMGLYKEVDRLADAYARLQDKLAEATK